MASRRLTRTFFAAALLVWGFAASSSPANARVSRTAPGGVIPFVSAEVRAGPDGRYQVTWSAPAAAGPVRVFASPTDGRADDWRDVGGGASSGDLATSPLPDADRWWFRLRPARGHVLDLADRSLHLASAPNFRDVGGYRTVTGQWVRMGLAYRSDGLEHLSDADLARLTRLAPAIVADLRTAPERARGPDRLPDGATSLIADVAADAGPLPRPSDLRSPEAADAFLLGATRGFVSLPSARRAYASLFTTVEAAGRPIVYHCSAGKDRTGWASAVLLSLLGVPRDVVYADYLASNAYLAAKNQGILAAQPPETARALTPMLTVRSAYLDAAFEEANSRYGSLNGYLAQGLGLSPADIARLRARFLVGEPTAHAPFRPMRTARTKVLRTAASGRVAGAQSLPAPSAASVAARSAMPTHA